MFVAWEGVGCELWKPSTVGIPLEVNFLHLDLLLNLRCSLANKSVLTEASRPGKLRDMGC